MKNKTLICFELIFIWCDTSTLYELSSLTFSVYHKSFETPIQKTLYVSFLIIFRMISDLLPVPLPV